MPETHKAVRHNERPPKIFAAVPGLRHTRGLGWSEMDMVRRMRAGVECYNLLTKEELAMTGWRATTARVKTTTSLRRPATKDAADTHDGALFRRLEEFFAARRAEVRANKLSAPA